MSEDQLFRGVAERVADVVALLDGEGRILFANPALITIAGAARAAAGTPFDDLLDAASRGALHALLAGCGSAEPAELTLMGEDGASHLVRMHGCKRAGSAGALLVGADLTKSRRVENEMHLLGMAVSSTKDAFTLNEPGGTILFVNPAFCEMYGYTDDELVGRHISMIYSDANPPGLRETIIGATLKGGWNGELLNKKKDGSDIAVELWTSVVKDPAGVPIAYAGVARDISAQKHSGKLESALYRIAELTNTTADMDSFYRSVHGVIGELMPAKNFYIALYDEPSDTLSFPYFVDEVDKPSPPGPPGRGLTAYVLRSGATILCDEALTADLIRRGEAVLVGAPSPIWLGVPLVTEGKTIGVMVVQHYTDPRAYGDRERQILEFVSSQVARAIEHKRAEAALRVSQATYRQLFEESQDGICITTVEGKLVDANPAFLGLLGFSSKEDLLRTADVRSLYVDSSERDRLVRQLLEKGIIRDFEFSVRRRDGEERIVLENASLVRNAAGEVTHIRAYLRDITARKRLEEQLRQSQKMEGIGTLAGGIAHDFNNILGIILGYANRLEPGKGDPRDHAGHLATIRQAVSRGADLVRQLLTFARKSEPSFGNVDVNVVVLELTTMLAQTFPRSIEIRTDLDEFAPAVIADAAQLHQALFNLAANARDAMTHAGSPASGSRLTIATRAMTGAEAGADNPGAEKVVAISVTDNGAGMDEETKRRIFEPFFTTKQFGQGTGLGLAVVYGVVNSHHARVRVESARGKGTTFTLFFPVPAKEAAVQAPAGGAAGGEGDRPRGSETLLVVEDEEMLAILLKGILEEQGYSVYTAKDGQEGLDIYREHAGEIALVLSDMGLPRLGGWEMFQEMKKVNEGVRAILASGYFDPNLKIELIRAGAKDFVQKPYVAETILQRIRDVIDGR